jgi:hypothetical protein
MLPLKDDSNETNKERMGDLRESLRDSFRVSRVDILKKPYYSLTTSKNLGALGVDINDCNKLLRDLERKTSWGPTRGGKDRKVADKYIIQYFTVPVDQKLLSDYAVYVRKPMVLSLNLSIYAAS